MTRECTPEFVKADFNDAVFDCMGVKSVMRREGNRYLAHLSGGQASNVLSALVAANALVIIPGGQTRVEAGARVSAQMLDWPEDVF